MTGRIYNPDHTRHIREAIRKMVVRGVVGLALTALAGGVIAALDATLRGQRPGKLMPILSMAWAAVGGVCVLQLVVAGVCWMIYLHRRADLDARGAEAIGELRARSQNRRHGSRGHDDS